MKNLPYLIYALACLFIGGIVAACQSNKLPKNTVIKDPSPQLHYRYVSPNKDFSFDYPYYGHRFFKTMDTKAQVFCRLAGVKRSQILFYESTYMSHHYRTLASTLQNTEGVVEANFQRLKKSATVRDLVWKKRPIIKIDTTYAITFNDYKIRLDSTLATDYFSYKIKLENADFLVAEYYVAVDNQSLIRLIVFLNVDKSLLDETDNPVSENWFYDQANYRLAYFKKPIPPLDSTIYVPSPFTLPNVAFKKNAVNPYLAAVDTLLKNEYLYDSIRPEFKHFYTQMLMTYYSFAGFNDESFAARDTALGNSRRDSCPDNLFKGFQPTDAVSYIAQQSKNRRIVLLNEAHHAPICRIFALTLLDSLWKNGFRYLALEALAHNNGLKKNGFPTVDDGIYNREPMYGEMIRHAQRIGFQLVPYEAEGEECLPPPDAHRFYCHNQREQRQAENIMKIFRRDKKAKVFALVGHDHNYKNYLHAQRQRREGQKWAFLAMLLKKKSGFDPLSINQSDMLERSLREYESPFFRCVWLTFSPNKPTVLVKENTIESWKKPTFEDMVDAYIFHPRTSREIPYYWLQNIGYQSFKLDNLVVKNPFFLQIFYENEWKKVGGKAVPAYNLPLRGESETTVFLKPQTAYIVKYFSEKNELLLEKRIQIVSPKP